VVSASFPGDAFGFSSTITEELLDQNSLNSFLEAISALGGVNLDVDTAMRYYNCFLIGTDGTRHFFDSSATLVFPEGLAIEVESYRCIFGV
jgi:hypothetical protein